MQDVIPSCHCLYIWCLGHTVMHVTQVRKLSCLCSTQVGHLGEGYQEWVHQPIVQKESPRFFANNFLEVKYYQLLFQEIRHWIMFQLVLIHVHMNYRIESVCEARNCLSRLCGLSFCIVISWWIQVIWFDYNAAEFASLPLGLLFSYCAIFLRVQWSICWWILLIT